MTVLDVMIRVDAVRGPEGRFGVPGLRVDNDGLHYWPFVPGETARLEFTASGWKMTGYSWMEAGHEYWLTADGAMLLFFGGQALSADHVYELRVQGDTLELRVDA